MVYKEIVLCDVCGKEIKSTRTHGAEPLEITLSKELAEKLELKPLAHFRRYGFSRRRFRTMSIDICSKQCLQTLLKKIGE